MSTQMTATEAERQYHVLKEEYSKKNPLVSMIRDSWEGGHTVQFRLYACCTVVFTRSGDVVTISGSWA